MGLEARILAVSLRLDRDLEFRPLSLNLGIEAGIRALGLGFEPRS